MIANCALTCSGPTQDVYRLALDGLQGAAVEFLVGGAYAHECYTGIGRHTKDLDLFVRPDDCQWALAVLEAAGFRTELTFPHWLGKAVSDEHVIDIIFSSGNGVASVDDEWFTHAVSGLVCGRGVKLVPPEEMIWSKAYIMERERFDGADIQHLLHALAERLDWDRLLRRFGAQWRVLLSHLVLFGFVYPGQRARIPARVMGQLLERLGGELKANHPHDRLCQGTILSREQYLADLDHGRYDDARLEPHGAMSAEHLAIWTAAISSEPAPEPSDARRRAR